MALRLRRGTNAERLTITPEIGELIYTTDTKKVFVGDGSTAGGVPIDTGLLDLAGNSLNDLGDVATTAPTDTQVLAWNDANSNWEPADAATPDLSASGISDLSDVGIGVINNEQVLIWNDSASQFQPGDVLGLTTELSDIADVADQDPTDTQVLAWSTSQSSWVPTDAATPDLTSAVISDLSDVAIGVINDGQVLVWNDSASQFQPGDVLGATTELSDLADVADQAPTDTQVLAWNASSTNWEPQDSATVDLTSAVISDLSDVSIAVINSGQTLIWNGTNFVPGDLGGDVVSDTSPVLGGALDAGGFNITNAGTISAVNINSTNFTGNFIGTHSGDFNGDFDGNFVGSIYNEDSAIVFDAENNTVSNLISVTATEFVGDVTGDVTGNVTGDITGNVTGDITGNVTGDLVGDVTGNVTGAIDTNDKILQSTTETVVYETIGLSTGSAGPNIKADVSRGSLGTPTVLQAGDTIMQLTASGHDGVDYNSPAAILRLGVDKDTTSIAENVMPGRFVVLTYNESGSTGLANALVFNRFGRLGIGTDTPEAKLDVRGDIKAEGTITPGVYADDAARDAAITSPVAGMMIFNTTGAKFQGYDGASWVNLN